MNKNELMLGDWVILNYEGLKKPVRILRLHQHYADITTENGSEFQCVAYSLLEGMPLTEEMLKDFFKLFANTDNDCVDITHCNGSNGFMLYIYNDADLTLCIVYVHELQNALRICKLTELANNFKLKTNAKE